MNSLDNEKIMWTMSMLDTLKFIIKEEDNGNSFEKLLKGTTTQAQKNILWTKVTDKFNLVYLETQRCFFVAGDSGYPISEVLIKPFPTEETVNNRRKALFNRRQSGLRTVMTENIGILKRRFPILKSMRMSLPNSQKVIIACVSCVILENIARIFGEEEPEDDDEQEDRDDDEPGFVIEDETNRESERLRGKVLRNTLMENMAD